MIELLKHVPWYVYLIMVYLILMIIKSFKGRTYHLKKLIILPAIFIWMSVVEITHVIQPTILYILVWFVGMVIGAAILGWYPFHKLDVKPADKANMVYVPGNMFTPILIVVTFCVKFYIGMTLARNQTAFSFETINLLLFFSGLFTGAFIGRFLYAVYLLYLKRR
ncbi:MAG: hypothetical protein AAGA27_05005 [Pseudomonadota bacterium]